MRRVKRVWGQSIPHKIAIILAVLFLIAVVGGYTGSWYFSWTGLADYTKPSDLYVRGKTLWNWLELLIIPAVLAGGAMWFSSAERKAEREIADDRLREAALQAYLDRMTDLLLKENLRASGKDDEVRAVARARTLTTLRQLAGSRKGTLLRFLYEADLIERDGAIIGLKAADLSGADLRGADLSGANLSEADLREAKLSGAILWGSNLTKADLSEAELREANLRGAELQEANLSGADLSGAKLRGAKLSIAELVGAGLSGAKLWRADLSGADLSESDLSGAVLNEVTYDDNTLWPDDFIPPPDSIKKE